MEGKKAEEAESKITPPAAAAEEVKEAKQEEAEEKAEATVVGREEEEYKGAGTEKSAVEVETNKATETQAQENSSVGKTV